MSEAVAERSDEQLLRALHDEHAHALWAYVVRLTRGDRAKAQDVVQETLLRAWRTPSVLDQSAGSARGWLYTVARRIVIDEWRAARGRGEEVVDEVPEPPGADPDGVARHAVDRAVVVAALRSLSPEHRDVVLECYFRGSNTAEAAAALGIPPGTVKSRLHYALRRLRLSVEVGGSPVTDPFEHDDAAYVLDALPPGQRTAYERHLAGCPSCAARVAELAGARQLLAGVTAADLADPQLTDPQRTGPLPETLLPETPLPETLLPGLLRQVAAARRHRRRRIMVAAAAAAAACLVALLVGVWPHAARPGPGGAPHALVALRPAAMSATATLTPTAWGTAVELRCRHAPGSRGESYTYDLLVYDRSGARQDLGSWTLPPGRDISFAAGTSLAVGRISRLDVTVPGGPVVLRLRL